MSVKKRGALGFVFVSLLVVMSFSVFCSVQANGQTLGGNIPPDMPVDALQYNRTDITPSGDDTGNGDEHFLLPERYLDDELHQKLRNERDHRPAGKKQNCRRYC